MQSILINTTPQQKQLYAVKWHRGEAFPLPFHMHERYELTCILKGKGTRIIGDHVSQYENGDVVLLAPHTPHQWQSSGIEKEVVSAITVFISPEFPSKDFHRLPEFQSVAELLESSKFGVELKGELRKEIAQQIGQLSGNNNLGELLQILAILNRISESGQYKTLMNKGFSVTKKQDQEKTNALVLYIRQHISEKITIDQLAEVAFLHPGSVNRFFKKSTGFSLIEYINLMRVGLACELLSAKQKTILDISLECGFANQSNFNRIFKRIKKVTPREYRKRF